MKTKWDELIADANRQIDAAKLRIAKLRKTVRSLKQLRDSGEKWPIKRDDEALSAAPERP